MRSRPVHVLPFADMHRGGRDHSPSATCFCGPVSVGPSITEPSVVVWRHRTPPVLSARDRQAARDFKSFEQETD